MAPIKGEARLDAASLRRALVESSLILRYRWVVHGALLLAVGQTLLRNRGLRWENLLGAIAVVAFSIGLSTVSLRWQIRHVLKTLGADRGPIQYLFDTDLFTVTGPASSVTMAYADLRSGREGPSTFALRGPDAATFYVPKEAFSPADALAVSALLREQARPATWETISDVFHLAMVLAGVVAGAWLILRRLGG